MFNIYDDDGSLNLRLEQYEHWTYLFIYYTKYLDKYLNIVSFYVKFNDFIPFSMP